MNPIRLLLRFWHALSAAWSAGTRAWNVAGTIDSSVRRHQLRLAMLDADELHRLYHASQSSRYQEELYRRGRQV